MSGAIHPFPQHAFMAWCSVKAQGQKKIGVIGIDGSNWIQLAQAVADFCEYGNGPSGPIKKAEFF
jgi:hypothetical protein